MTTFTSWELSNENIDEDFKLLSEFIKNNICSHSHLLNTHNNNMSLIEKYVFEIAMFQFKKIELVYDSKLHYIEFWHRFNPCLNTFHTDTDEHAQKISGIYTPLLSMVLYINDSIYPTILTNIDSYEYQKKSYNKKNKFCLSFPRKKKLVTFDGKYIHSATNIINKEFNKNIQRATIMINLWNKKPCNVNYFDYNNFTLLNNSNDVLKMYKSNSISNNTNRIQFNKIINSVKLYPDFYIDNFSFFYSLFDCKYKELFLFGEKLIDMYGENLLNMGIDNSIVECYLYPSIFSSHVNSNKKFETVFKQELIFSNQNICDLIMEKIINNYVDINNDIENYPIFFDYLLKVTNDIINKIIEQITTDNISNFQIYKNNKYVINNIKIFDNEIKKVGGHKPKLNNISFIFLLNNNYNDIEFVIENKTFQLKYGEIIIFTNSISQIFTKFIYDKQYFLYCNFKIIV